MLDKEIWNSCQAVVVDEAWTLSLLGDKLSLLQTASYCVDREPKGKRHDLRSLPGTSVEHPQRL